MPAGYSFHPRAWVLALAALAAGAGIALGNWQAGRAEEKRAAADREERAAVTGTFLPQYMVFLDNKVRHGRAGYEVVMPLRMAGSDQFVLVNRGWTPAPARRERLPEVRTPAGSVSLEGVVRAHFPRLLEVRPQEGERVRQTLDIESYQAETGLALVPYYIEQHSQTPDGLVREWQRPDAGVEKHDAYALQWYSLAALAVVLGLVFSFRRVGAP